ncbi:MAG: sigma-70 family RNA polymerase sigma factor [Clostridia bacterium]|nr:sigma-70 family RNA polymerase sigma factor [Clostridia bacterium]
MLSDFECRNLIENYSDMLMHIAMGRVNNRQEAEDIVEEVFIKVAVKGLVFESAVAERAYLIRAVINGCHSFHRLFRSKELSLSLFPSVSEKPQERRSDVLAAVASLPPKYRDAVYLHYYKELTAKEISQALGDSVSAVEKRLSRARKMLKDILGEDYGYEAF